MASNQQSSGDAAHRIDETANVAGEKAEQGKGLLQSVGNTVASYAISAKNAVVGKGGQAAQSAKESGNEGLQQTQKGMEDLKLDEKANQGAQQSKSFLQSIGDSVVQSGISVKDAVVGKSHEAGVKTDEAKDNAGKAADSSKGYLGQLGDQVVSLKDKVVGTGSQQTSTAQEKLGQAKESTGLTVKSGADQSKGMLQTVGGKASQYAQTAKDYVVSSGTSAKVRTEQTNQGVGSKVVDTTYATKDAVVNTASKAYSYAADLTSAAYQKTATAGNSAYQTTGDYFKSAKDTVSGSAVSAKNTAADRSATSKD